MMRYNEFLYMDKIVYNNFIPMYIYEKQHIIIYTYRSVSADVFPIQLGKKKPTAPRQSRSLGAGQALKSIGIPVLHGCRNGDR